MFSVNSKTKVIDMHQGDTGSVTFTITGYSWSTVTAKAIFTMRKKNGTDVLKESSANLSADGKFKVEFVNSDTDTLTPGYYEYDVVVVVTPVTTGGKVTDGTIVRTLIDPTPLILRRRVNAV